MSINTLEFEKKYGSKKDINKIFSIPIKTIDKDLAEMRLLTKFSDAIIRPSYKRLLINIEMYEKFEKKL